MKVTVATSTGPQELAKVKFLPSSPINFPHPMSMMASPHIRGFILREFDCRKLHRTVRRQRMTKKIKKWKRSVFRARHNLPSSGCGVGSLPPPPKLPSTLPKELSAKLSNKMSTTINIAIESAEQEATTTVLPPSKEECPPTPVSPPSMPTRKRRAECLLISPIHSAKKSDHRPRKIDQMMLSARQLLDCDEGDPTSTTTSSCDVLVSPIAKKRRFF